MSVSNEARRTLRSIERTLIIDGTPASVALAKELDRLVYAIDTGTEAEGGLGYDPMQYFTYVNQVRHNHDPEENPPRV